MEWSAIANLAIGILGGGGALIALVAFLMRLDAKVGRIDKNVKYLVSTVDKLVDHIHNFGERVARTTGRVEEHVRNISEKNKGAAVIERPEPAVPINASVTGDAIICLEDGKSFKTLKRHLMTAYGMTPAQYRARWNLPKDYPMVAPNYSAQRSQTAKRLGLGRKSG